MQHTLLVRRWAEHRECILALIRLGNQDTRSAHRDREGHEEVTVPLTLTGSPPQPCEALTVNGVPLCRQNDRGTEKTDRAPKGTQPARGRATVAPGRPLLALC